jgi:hypothetical protein
MSIKANAVHVTDPYANHDGHGVGALPVRRRPIEHAVDPPCVERPPPRPNDALP